MKRLLERVADDETGASLRVIDAFDRLVADGAGAEELVGAAAGLCGREVGLDDVHAARALRCLPAGAPEPADREVAAAVSRAAVAARLRGRRAVVLDSDLGAVVAASIEWASGRLGVVWAHGSERPFGVLDQLVVERLAAAAGIAALRQREQAHEGGTAAVERLLCGELSVEEATVAARRARLEPAADHLVLALRERPAAAVSPDALCAAVARACREAGVAARGAAVGREPVVVARAAQRLGDVLDRAVGAAEARGVQLDVGVGDPAPVHRLARSLAEAREALLLGGAAAPRSRVTRFAELGVIHLLAQIPREEVRRSPEVRAVAALDGAAGGTSDLTLLETYCETGSLRQTAARLYLHHSSVDYRLKRLEDQLGMSLTDPADRLRALLAVRLVRIEQLRETAG
jgi:hypothetical protein